MIDRYGVERYLREAGATELDHADVGTAFTNALQHLEAIELGQHHVKHHDVVVPFEKGLPTGFAVLAVGDVALHLGQTGDDEFGDLGFIFDQQHAHGAVVGVHGKTGGHLLWMGLTERRSAEGTTFGSRYAIGTEKTTVVASQLVRMRG